MNNWLLGVVMAISPPVVAGELDTIVVEESVDHVRTAEYNRLSQELQRLTQRGAWAGVERTFRACEATEVELSFDDLLAGAYSARAAGDVTAVRERLLAAHTLREDKEVLDWVWDVDHNYGRVFIAGDVGKVELAITARPFNPDQSMAVDFAIKQVAETGTYDGYLPAGTYVFGSFEIEVVPRVQSTRVDLRSNPERTEKRKSRKK